MATFSPRYHEVYGNELNKVSLPPSCWLSFHSLRYDMPFHQESYALASSFGGSHSINENIEVSPL